MFLLYESVKVFNENFGNDSQKFHYYQNATFVFLQELPPGRGMQRYLKHPPTCAKMCLFLC